MSITIKYILYQQFPAYHKGLWVFDSDRKTESGMRYIIDVYSGQGETFFNRWDPAPRPVDGYGLFSTSDLNALVDPSKDVRETSVGWIAAPNNQVNYRLVIGEKTDKWRFSDNAFFGGNLGFISSSPTDLQVGDRIIVTQDAGYTYAQYEGFATVIATSGSPVTAITLDKSFQASTGPEPGYISKEDGSSFVVSGLTSGQTSWIYGASLNRNELESYGVAPWIVGTADPSTTANLLTDMPNRYKMRTNSRMIMSVPNYSGNSRGVRFTVYDQYDNQLGSYSITAPGPLQITKQMCYACVGPYDVDNYNPTVISGVTEPINASAYTFAFHIVDSGGTQVSERISYTLDQTCKTTEYLLLFLDRKGTWNTAAFTANADVEEQTKKKSFLPDRYGTYDGSFVNDTAARGYDIYDSKSIMEYTVRTEPMVEADGDYLSQIYSSPCVYWMQAPEVWLPVIVSDKQVKIQATEHDSLIQYEVTFKLAYNNNINW